MQRLHEHEQTIREADAFLARYGAPPGDPVRYELARVIRATRDAIEVARLQAIDLMPYRPGVDPWTRQGLAMKLKPDFAARERRT